jgi:hypothetical protein
MGSLTRERLRHADRATECDVSIPTTPTHTHAQPTGPRTDLIEQDVIVEGSFEDIALHALPVCVCRRQFPTSDEHGEQAHELAQRGCVYARHEQLPTPFVPKSLVSLPCPRLREYGGVGGTNLGQPPDK